MANRYFVGSRLILGPFHLEGPEAHHMSTVCRLRPGDQVCLFNGDGREYPAHVRAVTRRRVDLEVMAAESPARELGFRLEVAAPLPRGDRGHFLVEKLTELGVTSFTPLRTQRSVVHPAETRVEKLQRYVVEASKQCGRNLLMRVESLTDWETYCKRNDLPLLRFLAHPGETSKESPRGRDTVVAVGPEGGFTQDEVELARGFGWRGIGLGPRVLRVETAALVLAALTANTGPDRTNKPESLFQTKADAGGIGPSSE
jgi:16S rRNA (uracil1498-N3)-methyltransferase